MNHDDRKSAFLASSLTFVTRLARSRQRRHPYTPEDIISSSLSIPMPFALGGLTEVNDDINGLPHRVMLAAGTALSNNLLLARLLTFDDDPGPDSPSVDCAPLELEFSAAVGGTFEGFDIDDDAATAALSTLFKNGLGKFSSSANRTPGRMAPGWDQ